MAQQQQAGIYLSIPNRAHSRYEIERITHECMPYADLLASDTFEEAVYSGMATFVALGYDDTETVYATLYQIDPNGGLDWSECFPIDGPGV